MAVDSSGRRFSSSPSGSAAHAHPEARVPREVRTGRVASEDLVASAVAPAISAEVASEAAVAVPVAVASEAAVPAAAPDAGKPLATISFANKNCCQFTLTAAFLLIHFYRRSTSMMTFMVLSRLASIKR